MSHPSVRWRPPIARRTAYRGRPAARRGRETSPRPPATARSAPVHGCCGASASGVRRLPRRALIATDGCPASRSCWFSVAREPTQRLLGVLHVLERELAGFDEVGHDRLGAAAEEAQELVNQPPLCGAAGDERLEDVRVP